MLTGWRVVKLFEKYFSFLRELLLKNRQGGMLDLISAVYKALNQGLQVK